MPSFRVPWDLCKLAERVFKIQNGLHKTQRKVSVGKENKQLLQTLQIDNAWSKILNYINLTFCVLQHTSLEETVSKLYSRLFLDHALSICNMFVATV